MLVVIPSDAIEKSENLNIHEIIGTATRGMKQFRREERSLFPSNRSSKDMASIVFAHENRTGCASNCLLRFQQELS